MKQVKNIRQGFATNSSSSHSLIYVREGQSIPSGGPAYGEYGWSWFILDTLEDKIHYALTDRMDVDTIVEATGLSAQRVEEIGRMYGDDCYIDHESYGTSGTVDAKQLFSDNVVIVGGNDNDSAPDWLAEYIDLSDSNKVVKQCDTIDSIVIFDKPTGKKIRYGSECEYSDFPELVDVKITNYCDEGCSYCYQGSTVKGKHAKLDDVKRIIEELANAGTFELAIGGGEPTTHPDFAEILKFARATGVIPNFTTRRLNWVLDNATTVVNTCGAYALSIDTVEALTDVTETFNQLKNEYDEVYNQYTAAGGYKSGLPNPWQSPAKIKLDALQQMNIQVVLGTVPEYEFGTMVQWAIDHGVSITVLGYKTTGRGKSVTPCDDSWFPRMLHGVIVSDKLHHASDTINTPIGKHFERGLSLGVDTCVIEKFGDSIAEFIDPVLFTTKEGTHSMYIDATTMKCDDSSYVHGKASQYKFDADWQTTFAKHAKEIANRII